MKKEEEGEKSGACKSTLLSHGWATLNASCRISFP
jgi:hypothetical protein